MGVKSQSILPYSNQVGGWLDVFQPPVYKSDGKAFLQILPRKHDQDGLSYPHIQLVNDLKVSFYRLNVLEKIFLYASSLLTSDL